MKLWVLRLFGYPVLTFGPEMTVDEPEQQQWIRNTGGQFELAEEAYSPEYEEEEWEDLNKFGFQR